jgi:hypothetical protein
MSEVTELMEERGLILAELSGVKVELAEAKAERVGKVSVDVGDLKWLVDRERTDWTPDNPHRIARIESLLQEKSQLAGIGAEYLKHIRSKPNE